MAPKIDPKDPAVARLVDLFATISLTGQKAIDTIRNPNLCSSLENVIEKEGLSTKGLDAKGGTLVVSAVTLGINLPEEKRSYVVRRILDGSLKTTDQVSAACKYIEPLSGEVDQSEFDRECGVGVTVTPEQCKQHAVSYVSAHKAELGEDAWAKMPAVMGAVRGDPALRWASALDIKAAVEQTLEKTFGPRRAAGPKAKKAKEPKNTEPGSASKEAAAPPAPARPDAMFEEGFLARLHKPGENPQIKPELREQHLAATKGMVFTRFPPEPNGFLHIGHSKAIAVNFGFAKYHGGLCYLRYDDTNPEAEEERYFESILEMVRWLGFEPFKITYSSDYFQRLYKLAVELIKRDKAYVDHSTAEEIKIERGGEERGDRKPSKWRSRPIEESLQEFDNMKNGKYRPGQATLRMKQDILGSGNPQMWDLIAFRVLDAPHHRTGTDWRMYPTYDFTHCLVDSFENISHSLCTTEFILSRESYEWLCDALEVYKPRQYEYGRLDLEGTVMSKRKILKLVKEGHIKDWDDPRLFTLIALRRRGVPPGAILSFVSALGVTTAKTTIQANRLDQSIRQYLETSTPRLMMVVKPLKVTLENVPEDFLLELEKPLHPKIPEMGTNKIPLTRTLYIDASDFRAVDSADYFRLAPGKTVGLLTVPHPITCTSFKTDEKTGEPTEVICRYENEGAPIKVKTYIQWVGAHAPSGSPVRVDETRVFHPLFTSENPAAEENYLDHIDPNSLETISGALVEVGFWKVAQAAFEEARRTAEERTSKAKEDAAKAQATTPADGQAEAGVGAPERKSEQLVGNEVVRFQGMRIAYFALDKESQLACLAEKGAKGETREGDRIILNRIVSLKEDTKKESSAPAPGAGKKNKK